MWRYFAIKYIVQSEGDDASNFGPQLFLCRWIIVLRLEVLSMSCFQFCLENCCPSLIFGGFGETELVLQLWQYKNGIYSFLNFWAKTLGSSGRMTKQKFCLLLNKQLKIIPQFFSKNKTTVSKL